MLLRTCGRNVLDWKTSTAFCPNEGELVGLVMVLDTAVVFMDHGEDDHSEGSRDCLELKNSKAAKTRNNTETMLRPQARRSNVSKQEKAPPNWFLAQKDTEHVVASKQVSKACATARPQLCRPVSFDMTSQCLQRSQEQIADSRLTRLTSLSLGAGGWIRRSESTSSVTHSLGLSAKQGKMRSATSLPHIAKAVKSSTLSPSTWPCLLVALRPVNLEQEKHKFFQCDYKYDPQFKYAQPEPKSVLDKYCEGSDFFLEQAVGIMECVLKKFGSYENFEEVTGGTVLPKSQVWATVRKYLQKEGCVGSKNGKPDTLSRVHEGDREEPAAIPVLPEACFMSGFTWEVETQILQDGPLHAGPEDLVCQADSPVAAGRGHSIPQASSGYRVGQRTAVHLAFLEGVLHPHRRFGKSDIRPSPGVQWPDREGNQDLETGLCCLASRDRSMWS
ncbi:uncharacterized protein kiaa0895l isoform X3 [Syngnathoides biaculeatus]|uniref:uncharacterized protein kiaa0895l isoform X3 n=1 Tax=Syngnathoides biaculeatus TaxID=300417 RepID=UPI002ADDB260|nr:uncharacterized protein kiaa0895l isoform X3 [Syngnathoides biaculeatus]